MSTRAAFISRPYGGYYHTEVPTEDAELTHVGPGTPCGEYLRRFWHPVAVSDELKDLPVRIKILGEDLVIFRDGSGQIGLLELHCAHRGASLEYGLICDKGIRCCYHGWQYDVDGRVLETPEEPPDSTLKDRLCQGAYPTYELAGTIFAYMGPPEKQPPFPMCDRWQAPGFYLKTGKKRMVPCNWLQMQDNAVDPVHVKWLHTLSSGRQFQRGDSAADLGEIEFVETTTGVMNIRSKRVGDNIWVGINQAMIPNVRHIASASEDGTGEEHRLRSAVARWNVPIDDTSTMGFSLSYIREGEEGMLGTIVDAERVDRPYGEDGARRSYEEQQRHPNDYEAQVSQRPIAVHGLEHLAASDRGVIMFRNIIRRGIKAVQNGEDPPFLHLDPSSPVPTLSSHTVLRVPRAATPGEDRQLAKELGRKIAQQYLDNPSAIFEP